MSRDALQQFGDRGWTAVHAVRRTPLIGVLLLLAGWGLWTPLAVCRTKLPAALRVVSAAALFLAWVAVIVSAAGR